MKIHRYSVFFLVVISMFCLPFHVSKAIGTHFDKMLGISFSSQSEQLLASGLELLCQNLVNYFYKLILLVSSHVCMLFFTVIEQSNMSCSFDDTTENG